MDTLKPCPFCGGEARTIEPARYGKRWGVLCECGAFIGFKHTEAEAIKAWNTRTERTCNRVAATCKLLDPYGVKSLNLKTRYICSECNTEIMPWFRYCEFCGAKVVSE